MAADRPAVVAPGGEPPAVVVDFDDLLREAKRGTGWALTRLWDDLSGPVFGYLRAHGATDPEDLTSEVFLGAFRNLARFRGDQQALRTWIFTIAHRRLVDDRRRRGRRPAEVPLDDATPEEVVPDVAEHVLARDAIADLRGLLDELPPIQRDVILLRVVAGLSADEAGRILGRRPGHVRVLQHRALNALRDQIAARSRNGATAPAMTRER